MFISQASSVPMVWGKMILESNGLSYMDFQLQVDNYTATKLNENETLTER